MRVLFLGTGGYHPNERRHTACIMLPESGILFDAGTSFFRVSEHLATDEVDIFLSHAHLDHIIGLTYFLVPLLKGDVKQARVHGTGATLEAVRNHLFAEAVFPVLPNYDFRPLNGSVDLPDGGVLSHHPLEHPGGCTGYRIDWPDQSLAYITDTTAGSAYAEFIRGVDLLIHECYFDDAMAEWSAKTGHSHTTPVAELARDAEIGRLAIVHVDPHKTGDDPIGLKTARAIFPNTILAEDGMELEL